MGAGLLPLYFDTVNKALVFSENNPRKFTLPDGHQEDGLIIDFMALKRIRENASPYFERVSLAGYSLFVSVGTAGSVLASQNVWSISADNYVLSGTVNLKTAGIDALADRSQQFLEIRLFNGTNYYRGQFPLTIVKAVATAGALVAPAGDTALGALEADRIYARKERRAGEADIYTSADGTKKGIVYLDNDGSFRMEPIS